MKKRTNLGCFLLVFVFVLGIEGVTLAGEIIYVKAGATGANTGASWADAYVELEDGLSDADPCDEIWVAEGTYRPTALTDPCDPRTATFQMKNGVAIYGGFSGTGNPGWEDHDPNQYESILSGDLVGNDVEVADPCDLLDDPCRADNCYHVFYHPSGTNLDTTATLDGFTITAGNADGSGDHDDGGGMYNRYSSPIVTGCTFRGNSAEYNGGGIENYSSSPTVMGCTFNGNSAERDGGGMHGSYSSPTVTGCIFSGNSAWRGGGMNGGGTLTKCTFSGNSADYGGGMYGGGTLTNCTFSGNSANSGGGMYNDISGPIVTNCTFSGNSATRGGGMSNADRSDPTVTNCTFSGNSADSGGGMYNDTSSPTVTGCTFSGNSVEHSGGGMYNGWSSSPTVSNCTFVGNTAANGNSIACDSYNQSYPSTLVLTNCILWDGINEIWNNDGSEITITYSNIQGGWPGLGNIDADPLFVDADGADDIVGTTDDNLHLLGGSPCLDAADNDAVPLDTLDLDGDGDTDELIPFDLDGVGRFLDDPDASETGNPGIQGFPIIDMGAYEGTKGFWLSATSLTISEGQQMTFSLALTSEPTGTVEVTVDNLSGDPDIIVLSGETLFFDATNYWEPQSVTLVAAEDSDNLNGQAFIWITMTGFDVFTAGLVASEVDNDPVTSILFVDAGGPGINNGSSWAEAYHELRDAISIAQAYPEIVEEIRVAQGVYKPAGPFGNRKATFQLMNGLPLYGGFPSGGSVWEDRNPNAYKTILSGDLNGDDGPDFANNDENSLHVVTVSDTGDEVILDGFTITAGNADGSSWLHSHGGGMHNESGSPTVSNCTFTGNIADFAGGGMCNDYYSHSTVISCTFIGNSANYGGGMYNHYRYLKVTNCSFSGNSASLDGGGMYNYCGGPIVTGCTFTGNSAVEAGGGSFNESDEDDDEYAEPVFTNCTFAGNSADYIGGTNSGYGTLSNCILWGNTASSWDEIPGMASVSYSCVRGGHTGTGNIDVDPCFIDADGTDNIPGNEDDDLHLMSYSPCIDEGDPARDYSGQVDMDGEARVRYGRVDMGADEVFPIAGDVDADEDVDAVDFGFFGGYWLAVCAGPGWCGGCDVDMSGEVDLDDFARFTAHWLKGTQ